MHMRRVLNPALTMKHGHSTKLTQHRKRSGFTQKETGFLLGGVGHSAASRYETGERSPDLKTVFAYQVLFGKRAEELFPELYGEARAEVAERARQLSQNLGGGDTNARGAYKLGRLAGLATAV
jgi:transcriptional regulator with XRE-family HTH domain